MAGSGDASGVDRMMKMALSMALQQVGGDFSEDQRRRRRRWIWFDDVSVGGVAERAIVVIFGDDDFVGE